MLNQMAGPHLQVPDSAAHLTRFLAMVMLQDLEPHFENLCNAWFSSRLLIRTSETPEILCCLGHAQVNQNQDLQAGRRQPRCSRPPDRRLRQKDCAKSTIPGPCALPLQRQKHTMTVRVLRSQAIPPFSHLSLKQS